MSGQTVRLEVPQGWEGARLDQFLNQRLAEHTRSALRRLIVEGHVSVDGAPAAKPGAGLRAGMQIRVHIPARPDPLPTPEDIPLDVLYEDEQLIVVNKPAGLVVHPGHGCMSGTLVHALLGRGTALAPAGGPVRPGIVHRLDRGTSGIVVVAKTDHAHRALAAAFAAREVDKRYVALVWGHPEPPEGTIDRSIGRSRSDPVRMSVRATRGRAREAISRYRTIESLRGFAVLEVSPRTGRTHQIRVHLQSIHHPIVGDERYGGRAWRGVQDPLKRKALMTFDRLGLHAERLAFRHPATGKPVEFRAPLAEEFEALLTVLRQS